MGRYQARYFIEWRDSKYEEKSLLPRSFKGYLKNIFKYENKGAPKSVIKYIDGKEITGIKIVCKQDRCAYLSDNNVVVIPNPTEVKEVDIFFPIDSKAGQVSKP